MATTCLRERGDGPGARSVGPERPASCARRALFSLLLLALLALAGCGNGVNDLTIPAAPLAWVRGSFDLEDAKARAPGKPLRAAVVWGASPNFVLACFQFRDSESNPDHRKLQEACPDPAGFVPRAVGAEVALPLDGDGTFEIPLYRLPDAAVAVGTDAARMSWGSVVVVADLDEDGAVNLLSSVPDGPESRTVKFADQVVAASFVTIGDSQRRIGFREGGWDEDSLFYPTPGCAVPPLGFSTLAMPAVFVLPAENGPQLVSAPGECRVSTLGERIRATPLAREAAEDFACRSVNRSAVWQPADHRPTDELPVGATFDELCLDAETYAVIQHGDCPQITVFPLAGCRENLFCSTPDWDRRQQPPGWWPCGT